MARDYADVLNGTFGDEQSPRAERDLSVIFGSGIRLADDNDQRTQRRIVVYPAECPAEDAETVQGLMCALTWMLNALDNVFAMPLLIRAPGAWKLAESAFTPDDFTLDGLGEDTVVTSALSRDGNKLKLSISVTTEIVDVEDLTFDLVAEHYGELLSGLLDSASRFAVWLDGYETDVMRFSQRPPGESAQIAAWLKSGFALHRAMLQDAANETPLNFDGAGVTQFNVAYAEFRALTVELAQDATTWLFVQVLAQATVWFGDVNSDALIEAVKSLSRWQIAAPALSRALIEMNTTRIAVEILETAVEEAPDVALNWLVLARVYAAVQRADLMLEVLQRALEHHDTDAPLLMLYGDTMLTYAEEGVLNIQTVLLDEDDENPTSAREAVTAFQEVVRLTKGDQRGMAYVQLVTALSRYAPGKVWPAIEALAVSDATGSFTDLAINAVAAQDDIKSALDGLERATVQFPLAGQVWRNLAYVQYLSGDTESAALSIQRALQYADGVKTQGEYELLALYAHDAAIEGQLAETADVINAGTEVSDRTLEFLEWIVGEAPHYAEGYLLLATAYSAEDEGDTALEVLLDAEKNVGIDPDIVVAIVDLLVESGEESVALDYITKGLEAFPRHIPLLARAAQVTYALGDDEAAKAFLRQAHNIAPYHRELLRVTREISESEQNEE